MPSPKPGGPCRLAPCVQHRRRGSSLSARRRAEMLYSEYLAYLGHLALDEAFDSVDEVELRERAPLAGPQHLDADGAVLLVAGYDPGVSPIGPQRWTDFIQRVLHSALHVLLLHLAADYIRLWRRISSGTVVEW